jgi:hypothetical protein
VCANPDCAKEFTYQRWGRPRLCCSLQCTHRKEVLLRTERTAKAKELGLSSEWSIGSRSALSFEALVRMHGRATEET